MLLLSTTFTYVRTKVADLRTREDGVTAVEYALMVAIIALLMVAGFFLLFENVSTAFTDTGTCVSNAMTATISAYSTAVTPTSRNCSPPRRARKYARLAERYLCTRTGPLRFPYRSVLSFFEQLEAMPAGGSTGLPRRHDKPC